MKENLQYITEILEYNQRGKFESLFYTILLQLGIDNYSNYRYNCIKCLPLTQRYERNLL